MLFLAATLRTMLQYLLLRYGGWVGGGCCVVCSPPPPHRATFANYTPVIDMSYALNAPESVCFHFYWIKHVGRYRSFLYVFPLDCFWIEFRFVRFDTREGWLTSSSSLQHHFLSNAIDFLY